MVICCTINNLHAGITGTDYCINAIRRYSLKGHILETPLYFSKDGDQQPVQFWKKRRRQKRNLKTSRKKQK